MSAVTVGADWPPWQRFSETVRQGPVDDDRVRVTHVGGPTALIEVGGWRDAWNLGCAYFTDI